MAFGNNVKVLGPSYDHLHGLTAIAPSLVIPLDLRLSVICASVRDDPMRDDSAVTAMRAIKRT